MFDTVVASCSAISDGRAKAIAVTSIARSHVLPNVPTVAESGVDSLRSFESSGWFGLYGPANVSPALTTKLNLAVNKVIALPAVNDTLREAGATLLGGSPQAFAQHNAAEVARGSALIRRLGVPVD